MTNQRNLIGNRTASATWVRTAAVLAAVAIVLILIGALAAIWGVAIVGGILLGAAFVAGLVGMATA